jgi:hypothetical protein
VPPEVYGDRESDGAEQNRSSPLLHFRTGQLKILTPRMLAPVIPARDRWLKSNGVMIPRLVTAWAALVRDRHLGEMVELLPDNPYGLKFDDLVERQSTRSSTPETSGISRRVAFAPRGVPYGTRTRRESSSSMHRLI